MATPPPEAAPDVLPPRAYLVLFALWLMVFSSGSQVMLIVPIFPRIREQLPLPEGALGMLVAVDALLLGAVALIAGPISDRIGRRRIMLAGTGLMTAALALHALAFDYASLLAVRALAGAAGGVLSGAAVAYVGDYFPYRRRGWANGWVMTGMAFGHIIGLPAGTILAASLGFRIPYLVFAGAMAATFVLVLRVVPQPAVGFAIEPLSIGGAIRNYAALLRNSAIVAAVLTFAVSFLGSSLFIVFLPTWLEDTIAARPAQIAGLFFAGGVANVLAGPRAGQLSDRIGRRRLIIGATLGLALLVPALPYVVRGMTGAVLLFFLVMMLLAARMSPFQALLTQLVPPERRGSLMSLSVGCGQFGFAAGSTLAGFTYSRFGYESSTALASLFLLLTVVIVWRLLPEPDPDVTAFEIRAAEVPTAEPAT
jgi:predicted MFS family arabinose efflux permease